ncbi:MAG: YdiY family protein [Limisphaerales bacterium]
MKNHQSLAASVLAAAAVLPLAAQETNAPAAPRRWETTAAAGATVTAGNSDTVLFTADVNTLRNWENDKLTAGLSGGYGEDNSEVNNEFLRAFAQYNRALTDRWYAYGRLDFLYDGIADIDYRFSLSPGIGYHLIKNDRTTLSAEAGPGYVWEKVGGIEDDYPTIRFGERFTFKINDRARLWQSFEFVPQIEDFGNYFLSGELGIEADITKRMSLRVVASNQYRSEPADGRDENDFRLVAGVGYKF